MSMFRFQASGRSLVIECGSCGSPAVDDEAIHAPCEMCSASRVGWRLRTRRGESRDVPTSELDALLVRERRIDRIAKSRQPKILDLPLDPAPERMDRLEAPPPPPAPVAKPPPPAPAATLPPRPAPPVRPTPGTLKTPASAPTAVGVVVLLIIALIAALSQKRDHARMDAQKLEPRSLQKSPPLPSPSVTPMTKPTSEDRPPVPSPPLTVADLELQPELRTDIEVVGWSRDEETFALDITYQLDSWNPNRWRVRAKVDAASEQILDWQDLSMRPARVTAPERKGPPWNESAVAELDTDQLIRGVVIDPSTIAVRWCNKESSSVPTALDVLSQERAVQVTWGSEGDAINSEDCEATDAGWLFVRAGQPVPGYVLQWHVPSAKRGTTRIRVYRSPGQGRAVMVVADGSEDKLRVRFYSRLWAPQIFILHDKAHPELAQSIREKLDRPALFLSKNPNDPVFSGYNRMIVVRSSATEPVMALARSVSGRLGLPIQSIDFDDQQAVKLLREYAVADILIVYCGCSGESN